jgi:hypothetical protein
VVSKQQLDALVKEVVEGQALAPFTGEAALQSMQLVELVVWQSDTCMSEHVGSSCYTLLTNKLFVT